jgi:hypothetical protein
VCGQVIVAAAVSIAYIIATANLSTAYASYSNAASAATTTPAGAVVQREPQRQHVNVFVITDDTGCPAELIKKGMALPDPDGNKQYFPKSYDVVCFDVPITNKEKGDTNTFDYIEKVMFPELRKTAQEKTGQAEELYIFVYQQSLSKQFQDYIYMHFGAERARMVDGWANVVENIAFSPIWAAAIYHEGRHLAIHGTWHDESGRLLPDSQISCPPSFSLNPENRAAGAGLLKFLNIPTANLPRCSSY